MSVLQTVAMATTNRKDNHFFLPFSTCLLPFLELAAVKYLETRHSCENDFGQYLRTVPTKHQGFCAKLGPGGKSRSLKGLLESTKKNWGSHAFFRDN